MIIYKIDRTQAPNHTYNLKSAGNDFRHSNTSKNVTSKDFIYHYPVFGKSFSLESTQNHDSGVSLDFDASISKFCRLVPDKGQLVAMKLLHEGKSVLLTAPTGIGKTLVATYVMGKNLAEGKESMYTTPLKALSNQKYKEFCEIYGKENVGLLTGDVKINQDAPIKVMTTEIYRNMILGRDAQQRLKNVATVVHDEFHNMNDKERGEVWETSIMYTPPHVQQLWCSATIGNDKPLVSWSNRLAADAPAKVKMELVHISANERPVPLVYRVYDPNRKKYVPVIIEKFSLAKLKAAAAPEAKEPLYDIQQKALERISKKAGGDGSSMHGIKTLEGILDEPEGHSEHIETNLVKKLKFEPAEAKQISLLLSDKSMRQFNYELRNFSHKALSQPQPRSSKNSAKKMISISHLKVLLDNNKLSPELTDALQRLGNGVAKSGFFRIKDIAKGQDIPAKDLRKKLIANDAKVNDVDFALSKLVSVTSAITAPKSRELEMIEALHKDEKSPVIIFNFSQRGCDELKRECLAHGNNFLSEEEQAQVSEIISRYHKEGVFLGSRDETRGLMAGVAVHHAGKMPGHKALVEELAQKKLAKVIIATDTIGAGINVPARTVLFTKLNKFAGINRDGEKEFRTLSSNELHQIAGRAGRRGMDFVGYVDFPPCEDHSPIDIFNMVTAPADDIESNFKPTYSFVSNFIGMTKNKSDIEDAVDKSFLRESLNPEYVDVDQQINAMKIKFKQVANIITSPKSGCFRNVDGNYEHTLKGSIVAKARGVDSLLFATAMTEYPIEKLTPERLASVACVLTQSSYDKKKSCGIADDETKAFISFAESYKAKMAPVERGLGDIFNPNLPAVKYVTKWAAASEVEPEKSWTKIVTEDMHHEPHFSEGDLFKSVNRTVDVVHQIKEIAEYIVSNPDNHQEAHQMKDKMKQVAEVAEKSLKMLQKPPMMAHLR